MTQDVEGYVANVANKGSPAVSIRLTDASSYSTGDTYHAAAFSTGMLLDCIGNRLDSRPVHGEERMRDERMSRT